MSAEWDIRIAELWALARREDPGASKAAMILAEQQPSDPAALFELASIHDFLGHETHAVPLYRESLRRGLDPEREARARIQLASSLINVGEPLEAVRLLEEMQQTPLAPARDALLALALNAAGRTTDALRTSLLALAETLPRYQDAVRQYARDLT